MRGILSYIIAMPIAIIILVLVLFYLLMYMGGFSVFVEQELKAIELAYDIRNSNALLNSVIIFNESKVELYDLLVSLYTENREDLIEPIVNYSEFLNKSGVYFGIVYKEKTYGHYYASYTMDSPKGSIIIPIPDVSGGYVDMVVCQEK